MADSGTGPVIIIFLTLCIGLHMGDGDFFFHQLFGNSHAIQPIQRHIIDFSDYWCCLRVTDQMSLILRVTHQTEGRLPTTKLSLPGTSHPTCQHFFGNIPALHIVQDTLKRRNVHFLTSQAVHSVCNGNIAYIVFWGKRFRYSCQLRYNSYRASIGLS